MTAEPSAADIKREAPYSTPHYGGSAMTPTTASAVTKPRTTSVKQTKPEARRVSQRSRTASVTDNTAATGEDTNEDDPDDDDNDNDDDDSESAAKSAKKPKAKAASATSKASTAATGDNDIDKDNADGDDVMKANVTRKSRRELPPHTVAILKGWMLSPEHVKHPYPTDEDKQMLLKKTGINMKQLTNWFTNARKRIWKPMMRREHSRQLQTTTEFDPTQAPLPPHDSFVAVTGAPLPHAFRESEFPGAAAARGGVVRHSFDAGSLGPMRQQPPPSSFDPYSRGPLAYAMPPPVRAPQMPVEYGPRAGRSHSEALPGVATMDGYMDAAMRMRKRGIDDSDAMHASDKRYRRSATSLSPRSLKLLQDWVTAHAHLEYPFPTDAEKLQLSRDTGLDVQQIELWFKTNRERIGAANYAIQNGAPGLSPSQRRALSGRSIPSQDNSMFPPPVYGDRREHQPPQQQHRSSIPASGNPMFPPRPTPSSSMQQQQMMQRSSIPGNGNPQFPPPPSSSSATGRRDVPDAYYAHAHALPPPPTYGSSNGQQQYSGGGHGYSDAARHARSMSINAGQFMRPQPPHAIANSSSNMPLPPGAPGATGLPSLAARSILPRGAGGGGSDGPTMGQPRDGRSHTLDMGLFTDARRRKMNFQDILASTSAGVSGVHHAPTLLSNATGLADASGSNPSSAESHRYPHAAAAYSSSGKSYQRPHLSGPEATMGCGRCGARHGGCKCDDPQLRRIV